MIYKRAITIFLFLVLSNVFSAKVHAQSINLLEYVAGADFVEHDLSTGEHVSFTGDGSCPGGLTPVRQYKNNNYEQFCMGSAGVHRQEDTSWAPLPGFQDAICTNNKIAAYTLVPGCNPNYSDGQAITGDGAWWAPASTTVGTRWYAPAHTIVPIVDTEFSGGSKNYCTLGNLGGYPACIGDGANVGVIAQYYPPYTYKFCTGAKNTAEMIRISGEGSAAGADDGFFYMKGYGLVGFEAAGFQAGFMDPSQGTMTAEACSNPERSIYPPDECELDYEEYINDESKRVIIKGTIKSDRKVTTSGGAMETNKNVNGAVVKAFAGSWDFNFGKLNNGQICDNTKCVNPSRVDGMCAVSGRTRDYSDGDEFDCELIEDDCDPLKERGGCNGKFTLQTYKSKHNFNNANYLVFYCGSELKMVLSVGLGGITEKDPETGSPVINIPVSLDCDAENSPVDPIECVDYIARNSNLICQDASGYDGGPNAVGGDFLGKTIIKDEDNSYAGTKFQDFDTCPPGYIEDPPGTCKVPTGANPVDLFPQGDAQGARIETEVWQKLRNEASDIASIPNTSDKLLAGNPWCDMTVPAPYSEALDNAIPPCDNICKGNYPISDPNYSLSVNQRMCGGVVSNMFTPYEWEDQCNSSVVSPSTTPVCCLDESSDGTDCPADKIVYFDEVQPPTQEGLANKDAYRLPVECFPYQMCFNTNRVHSQNKLAHKDITDIAVELVGPSEAQKQQPHTNSDEKPFQSVNLTTTPVGSYETYGKYKGQANLSPVHGVVERSRAALFSTPYSNFGVDYDENGEIINSPDADFPRLGARGIYVISANGIIPSNCVYNYYDTGYSEVNNTFNRSSDCEWCAGGEYLSDLYKGEQSDASEFKTKGVDETIFDVLGRLLNFIANFLGLNYTNWDANKASGACTINGGESCVLSGEGSCVDIDCGPYCEAQADDDPANDIANPGDCCSYTNRQESYASASVPACGSIEYPIEIQYNFEGFNKASEIGYAGTNFYAQFRPPYQNDYNVGQIYTYDCMSEKEKDPDKGRCFGMDIGRGGPSLGEWYMDQNGASFGDWSF